MRGPARALLGTVAVLTVLTVSACGVIPSGQAQSDRDLRIMVPNTPGGGYDTTARTAARVMDETHIAPDVQVFNLPGAGGTVGLQRLVDERGNGDLALQMGLGVVGASHEAKADVTVARTTPIARLIEEAGAVVVRKDSPYRTVGDLITAWRRAPERLAVGGGSSPGGPDYLLPMELAKAVGIDPKKVDYVGYGGGGGDLLRRCSTARSTSPPAVWASSSTRSTAASCGSSPSPVSIRSSLWPGSRRSSRRASTWSSATGGASSPRPASATPTDSAGSMR